MTQIEPFCGTIVGLKSDKNKLQQSWIKMLKLKGILSEFIFPTFSLRANERPKKNCTCRRKHAHTPTDMATL